MADYWKQIKKKQVDLDKHLNKTVRLTALAVYGQVVKLTPVDTGRARGNWWVGLNVVPSTAFPAETKAEGASLQRAALADAQQQIDAYKNDHILYVSNNLPYIRKLNEGSSMQAPANFVESASQVGARKAKEIAKTRFGDE